MGGVLKYAILTTILLFLTWGLYFDGNNYFEWFPICFLQKGKMPIYWYFGPMLIIYLFLPPINWLFTKRKSLFYLTVFILVISCNIIFILNFFGVHIEQSTIQTFRLWNWFLYFLTGGFLKSIRNKISALSPYCIGLCFIICTVINCLFQAFFEPYMDSNYCEYYYSSIVVYLLCVTCFCFVLKLKPRGNKILSFASYCFLPVYTFHLFARTIILCFIPIRNTWLAPIILWALTSLTSLFGSYLIYKIPLINKIFKI